jgi:hypothetical protein
MGGHTGRAFIFRENDEMEKDKGHYAKKHPADRTVNPSVADALEKRAKEHQVPCATAFTVASEFKISPEEAGFTLDVLEIRLTKCQLGLFGYGPEKKIVKVAETVPGEMEESIRKRLRDNRLPCKTAWDIATTFGVKKMTVSSACEKLGIKIAPCQLGAF